MKKLFVAIIALAALAACAKEEIVSLDKGETIQFGNAFVENATRADYSSADITAFKVYGTVNNVNIFNGDNVTKGTAAYGDAWTLTDAETSQPITQYWIEGAAYKFAAVVDANHVNVDDYGMPVSLEYSAAGQKDMLYNYVEETGQPTGQNDTVEFNFTHLLAKAYFTVTNNTGNADYTYTIRDVKVTGTRPDGTYTVYTTDNDTGAWAQKSDLSNTSFASIENVVKGTPKSNPELLLIPEVTVGVSFTVAISVKGTEISTYNYSKANVATLAQNTIYNFGVSLTPGDVINFTVTAKPEWGSTIGSTEEIVM